MTLRHYSRDEKFAMLDEVGFVKSGDRSAIADILDDLSQKDLLRLSVILEVMAEGKI